MICKHIVYRVSQTWRLNFVTIRKNASNCQMLISHFTIKIFFFNIGNRIDDVINNFFLSNLPKYFHLGNSSFRSYAPWFLRIRISKIILAVEQPKSPRSEKYSNKDRQKNVILLEIICVRLWKITDDVNDVVNCIYSLYYKKIYILASK